MAEEQTPSHFDGHQISYIVEAEFLDGVKWHGGASWYEARDGKTAVFKSIPPAMEQLTYLLPLLRNEDFARIKRIGVVRYDSHGW